MASDDPWQHIVEKHFRVYETRKEAIPGIGDARLYFLMFPDEELEARYDATRQAILATDADLVVFLRREGGEDVLVVAPRAPVAPQANRANVVLLVLTLLTTITAGVVYWHGYKHVGEGWAWSLLWSPEHLWWGSITFALPLMAILGIHETAHYVAARRHGLRATLPYFIPFPPIALPIGTLGAFIRLKDPLPDRKALFDVGASGPIAGFILAVPILVLGSFMTGHVGIPVPELDTPSIDIDAPFELLESGPGAYAVRLAPPIAGPVLVHITAPDAEDYRIEMIAKVTDANGTETDEASVGLEPQEAMLRTFDVPADATNVTLRFEWDDHLIRFGDPLLVDALEWLGWDNGDYLTHPTFFAAWVGLLITGINLVPAGQLDGGHVARAVFGERMRYVAYAAVAGLFYLAFKFQAWMLMALFIVFMGLYHPPPLNDRVELDGKRKVMAVVVLLVFLLTFVARPVIL